MARTRAVIASLALGLACLGVGALPAVADSAPQNPNDPKTPPTVSADALPTVQINGVVWSQAVAGNRVYAGGSFTTARPAGASTGSGTVTRGNMLAYDIRTGELVQSFAPTFNAQVMAVSVTPDASRIYVVGDFTSVNGVRRDHIAAFDAATGALLDSFGPQLNGTARAVVATNSTVYVGGSFRGVGNQVRSGLAAFNTSGDLLNWAPSLDNGAVWALTIKPDGTRVVAGGSFTSLNGSSNPGYGLAMLDAVTGQSLPMAVNSIVRDATDNGAITTLASDENYVYGGGYTYGSKAGGTLEGVFSANWDGGEVHWINDCHGDTYSVFPQGDVIYQAGHSHYCENIDGFRQGDGGVGDYPYYRATAMSRAATGTATWEPDGPTGRYYSFDGQPTPSQLIWFPSMNAGTYTGQSQGPWSVAGNDDYVVMGGEFTRVNGRSQQGLVRYARPGIAPNKEAPRLSGTSYPIHVDSASSGTARVNWRANYDYDNEYLEYRVYRDGDSSADRIHTRKVRAPFWNLNSMTYLDTDVAPGSTHRYRVQVLDPFGNSAWSPWTSVTVASAETIGAYGKAVLDDEPEHFWRLGEADGTAATDTVGWEDAPITGGVTRGVEGAITGDGDTATAFNGTDAYAKTSTLQNPTDVFTLEAWFKTTSTAGGKILGWGTQGSGRWTPSKFDRHLYMDNSGKVLFGVKPNADRTVVTSPDSYNDGKWHQATATLGADGMKLYVDGERVAEQAGVVNGESLSRGYWWIGGGGLDNWPSKPTSTFFNGAIDDVAVYDGELSDADVARHYKIAAGTEEPPVNESPAAVFSSAVDGLTASVDGSGSSDPDGTVKSYAWDFGDGATGSGATASHTYAVAGTYQVKLTVTDDKGATGTLTNAVTVSGDDPGSQQFAADAFERSLGSGLGSADVGGPWTLNRSAGNYSVANGMGTITSSVPGATRAADLLGVSSDDTDLQVVNTLDKAATGGGVYVALVGRRVSGDDAYKATLRYLSDGSARLSLRSVVGGVEKVLTNEAVAGVTVAPGDRMQVRVQVTGTSPTTLRAKVWKAGDQEPSGWQLTTTDGSGPLQAPGSVGLLTYLSGSASNAPVHVSFDNLTATATG